MTADPIGIVPLPGVRVYETNHLYAYVGNNPLNGIDPLGLFKYYGDWCGPNHTGGIDRPWDQLTPQEQQNTLPPRDDLDSCCQIHDKCHADCRMNHPCSGDDRQSCFKRCDRMLANCAQRCQSGGCAEICSNGICVALTLRLARMIRHADEQACKRASQDGYLNTKKDRPIIGDHPSGSIFLVYFVFDRPICARWAKSAIMDLLVDTRFSSFFVCIFVVIYTRYNVTLCYVFCAWSSWDDLVVFRSNGFI